MGLESVMGVVGVSIAAWTDENSHLGISKQTALEMAETF